MGDGIVMSGLYCLSSFTPCNNMERRTEIDMALV